MPHHYRYEELLMNEICHRLVRVSNKVDENVMKQKDDELDDEVDVEQNDEQIEMRQSEVVVEDCLWLMSISNLSKVMVQGEDMQQKMTPFA